MYKIMYREVELERFIAAQGIAWNEKGQAPVMVRIEYTSLDILMMKYITQINGVFDPEKPIEKKIKAAAKFLSAEEEAKKRKTELEGLKSRAGAGKDCL